jgi:hypothetical protein
MRIEIREEWNVSQLRSYLVEGYVPRDRLNDTERKGLRKTAGGAWIPIGTFRTWGPRSAVEKALRQGWARDERAQKFRATLVVRRAKKSLSPGG